MDNSGEEEAPTTPAASPPGPSTRGKRNIVTVAVDPNAKRKKLVTKQSAGTAQANALQKHHEDMLTQSKNIMNQLAAHNKLLLEIRALVGSYEARIVELERTVSGLTLAQGAHAAPAPIVRGSANIAGLPRGRMPAPAPRQVGSATIRGLGVRGRGRTPSYRPVSPPGHGSDSDDANTSAMSGIQDEKSFLDALL